MSIKTYIADAITRITAGVTKDRELQVIGASYPPLAPQKVKPFRRFLTDDGLTDGTNDMSVDGSSTNVDYYIPAAVEEDRYITTLNFLVGYGTTAQPNEWADGTALSNGCRLFYSSTQGEVDVHEGILANQDFFRLSFSPIAGGGGASTPNWEIRHIDASNDFGYLVTMDLTKLGLPFGIKLDRGTQQRLTMRIRDNAGTAADSFNCIAYGFDRFE